MKSVHALPGIETDNLLGFLALLGLLRSLDHARPSWSPRLHFAGSPLCAQLTLNEAASQEEVAAAASDGCIAYANKFEFGEHSDLTFDGATARRLLEGSLQGNLRAQVMSALCSDAARRDDSRIEPTPLCAMFGQGHQSFLDRLKSVSTGTLPRAMRGKRAINLDDPAFLARALFSPWSRTDQTESFRWDFQEDRRYALRDRDPSGDAPTTEHGANRLAIVGMLSFQTAPTVRQTRVNLATRGVSRGRNRRPRITWPIWSSPASLEAIHAMLDDPELAKDEPSFDLLRRLSINQARRVRRFLVGKFINFSRAEAIIPH